MLQLRRIRKKIKEKESFNLRVEAMFYATSEGVIEPKSSLKGFNLRVEAMFYATFKDQYDLLDFLHMFQSSS